jgi:hypothetical protein
MSPSLPLDIALIATAATALLCGFGWVCFALGREVGRADR